MFKKTLLILLSTFAVTSATAQAGTSVEAHGGISLGTGDGFTGLKPVSLLLGGEATFGVGGYIDFGATVDYNSLSPEVGTGSASLIYVAALGRMEITGTGGVFVDGSLGMGSVSNTAGSSSNFGFGVGIGSKMAMGPTFEIRPRVGIRMITDSVAPITMFDVRLGFAFVMPGA